MLKFFLIGFLIIFIFAYFPWFTFAVFHPGDSIPFAFKDFFSYYKHKEFNRCKSYGRIFMFTASDSQAFGSGKTLSLVHWVRDTYFRYNNKPVWNKEKQDFVTQHIIVVSNIELKDIPFIPFVGKNQFIELDKIPHTEDDVIIFALDEAGFVFNSRDYKTNMKVGSDSGGDFLARLLQVRHNKICFVLSTQRQNFLDKIIRQTCEVVTTCKKKWRIVRLQDFDAYDLENVTNPLLIKPLRTYYYFANDKLYNSYDTTYNVEKLKEQVEQGELLNTEEILARIGDSSSPDKSINHFRRSVLDKKSGRNK